MALPLSANDRHSDTVTEEKNVAAEETKNVFFLTRNSVPLLKPTVKKCL